MKHYLFCAFTVLATVASKAVHWQAPIDAPTPAFLPVYSSLNPDQPNNQTTQLLIVVHGFGEDAKKTFDVASEALSARQLAIMAPLFSSKEKTDLGQEWSSAKGTPLTWPGKTWMKGGVEKVSKRTSFAVLDLILTNLATSGNFPNLKKVYVSGFSAGGQFTQRFSWFTNTTAVPLRVIVSNPGSYMYFTADRPSAQCTPGRNTGPNWTCTEFSKNNTCPGKSDKKGKYQLTTPLDPEDLARYFNRDILYLMGANDVCNCQAPGFQNDKLCASFGSCTPQAPNALAQQKCCDTFPAAKKKNLLDVSCEAMRQGSNRLQRGLLFASYLRFISQGKYSPRITVIPGMLHDVGTLFRSEVFRNALDMNYSHGKRERD